MSSSDNDQHESNKEFTPPLIHGVSSPGYAAAMKVALATGPVHQAKVNQKSTSLIAHIYHSQSQRSHESRIAS